MSKERKTYFLAPTKECPPSGPIVLGSIITSPRLAELPLATVLPIDEAVMPISTHVEKNWELMLEKHRNGTVGVWGSFLQALGAGGDIGLSCEISDSSTFHFDRLETQTFWPTNDYVKASICAEPVQEFLKKNMFRHNVYMVISVKIAYGASCARTKLRNRGVNAQLGVDGTSVGVPISVGPEAEIGWGKTESLSFERDSAFVFAFRLREICYTTRRGLRQDEFVKGAVFGMENNAQKEDGKSLINRGERDTSEKEPNEDCQGKYFGSR